MELFRINPFSSSWVWTDRHLHPFCASRAENAVGRSQSLHVKLVIKCRTEVHPEHSVRTQVAVALIHSS